MSVFYVSRPVTCLRLRRAGPPKPKAKAGGKRILYAIIRSGGKQYRVAEGDLIRVERLRGEVGEEIAFQEVLLVGSDGDVRIGSPLLADARVVGTITEQSKGRKIIVFKFKRRKMYRRKRGHRQLFTAVKIDRIELGPATQRPRQVGAEEETEAARTVKSRAQAQERGKREPETKKPRTKKSRVREPRAEKTAVKKPAKKAPKMEKPRAAKTRTRAKGETKTARGRKRSE